MMKRTCLVLLAFVAPFFSDAATTVDILVAYDAPAAAWVTGAEVRSTTEAFAADAVARMNEVLANSQLDSHFTFRLVGIHRVETDVCGGAAAADVGPKFLSALTGMYNGQAPWSGLKSRRDEVGADLVVVLADTGSRYGIAGVGNSLRADAPIANYAPYAYCICSVRSVAASYAMIHEVGHLMGAGHPDSDPFGLGFENGPQYDSASAAFTDRVHSRVTVMGYSGNGCTVIPYFSSPLLTVDGIALGDATHDNRLTLLNTYEQISRYRTAKSGGEVSASDGFNPQKSVVLNGVYGEGEDVRGVLQVKVGKASTKGESKVSVTVIGLDGKKYTAKAVKIQTGGTPTQTFEVKTLGTLTLTFGANGFSGTLNGATVTSVDAVAATTPGKATFGEADLSSLSGVQTDYLPKDETVTRTEKKWTVAKAGKLKYVKPKPAKGIAGGLVATGTNIAGLKLTYAAKTQTFKGSFKIWTLDPVKNKLKAVAAKVTGVVVNGTGYGEVTVKKTKIGKLTVK